MQSLSCNLSKPSLCQYHKNVCVSTTFVLFYFTFPSWRTSSVYLSGSLFSAILFWFGMLMCFRLVSTEPAFLRLLHSLYLFTAGLSVGYETWTMIGYCHCRTDSRFAPSQWGTVLHCNGVSHWLGANLESALHCVTELSKHRLGMTSSVFWISCNALYFCRPCTIPFSGLCCTQFAAWNIVLYQYDDTVEYDMIKRVAIIRICQIWNSWKAPRVMVHLFYQRISNLRCTKSPNLNVSCLVVQLSLPNPMWPVVKSRMKM